MNERRPLIDGLNPTRPSAPSVNPQLEREFVHGPKAGERGIDTLAVPLPLSRVPVSTRIRPEFATALKRASLERQLNGVEPNTLQDILEQAIEPWLKNNGYMQ
jgi:hypothetical protein